MDTRQALVTRFFNIILYVVLSAATCLTALYLLQPVWICWQNGGAYGVIVLTLAILMAATFVFAVKKGNTPRAFASAVFLAGLVSSLAKYF